MVTQSGATIGSSTGNAGTIGLRAVPRVSMADPPAQASAGEELVENDEGGAEQADRVDAG
jgi:hypothetical protein